MYALLALLGMVSLTCWLLAFTTDTATAACGARPRSASRSRSPRCSTPTTGRCSSAPRPGSRGCRCCGAPGAGGAGPAAAYRAARLRRRRAAVRALAAQRALPGRPHGRAWSKAPSLAALASVPARILGEVAEVAVFLGRGGRRARAAARARRARARDRCAARHRACSRSCSPGSARRCRPRGRTATSPRASRRSSCWPRRASRTPAGSGSSGSRSSPCCGRSTARPTEKSNVREVGEAIAPSLRPGDVVVATQPEQVSVLEYYLPDGPALRDADRTGPRHRRDRLARRRGAAGGDVARARPAPGAGRGAPGGRGRARRAADLRDRALERAVDAARAPALGGVAPAPRTTRASRSPRRAGPPLPASPNAVRAGSTSGADAVAIARARVLGGRAAPCAA